MIVHDPLLKIFLVFNPLDCPTISIRVEIRLDDRLIRVK